jgi:YidC/Oxa1 family membrane protein insertase
MDNQRLLVWAAFGVLLWLTYQTWMQDYGPAPVPAEQTAETETPAPSPTDEQLALPELGPSGEQPDEPATALPGSEPGESASQGTVVTVRTDVLALQIATRGGTLVRAMLLDYPIEKDRPDELVELLSPEPGNLGLIRTGLRGTSSASAHQDTVFEAAQSEFELGDADELVVPLTWTDESGVSIEKRFVFTRGSYAIRVEQTLVNNSDQPWRGDQYTQLLRRSKGMERSMFDVLPRFSTTFSVPLYRRLARLTFTG